MVGLASLLLPILVSAVAVFIASAIIWMALGYHKKDIQFLPQEAQLLDAIKPMSITPGLYMFPNCAEMKDMKNEEFQARWKAGPWGILTIMPKQPNFGLNLIRCFLTYLIISAIAGYLAGIGTPAGADGMRVFRVVGTAALLGHCFGGLANDFFLGKPARFIVTGFVDGVIFALITGGVFAMMWPGAPTP